MKSQTDEAMTREYLAVLNELKAPGLDITWHNT